MLKKILAIVLLLLPGYFGLTQSCVNLGQTPSTAFPVCGTSVFNQANVPICVTKNLPNPSCSADGIAYQDKNPYWYSFTCYTSGLLSFTITPKDLGDDYDWMLYDITGHSPNDVFTDASLIVTGNWAGTFGKTGASSSGSNSIQCASDPADNKNSFSSMPSLKEGHTYLLMVSHFTDSQSGYDLSFGGTAVITDPTLPALASADAGCGGVTVTVYLNKKMKCASLATDGSDFSLSPANATIVSAKSTSCTSGFDMDTLVLTMSGALAPGTYTLTAQFGSDGSTILDNCNRNIAVGDKVTFTVKPVQPTLMDSIKPVGCSPNKLELVFEKPILCSSVAPNGSDFIVTGPSAVTVVSASGNCSGTNAASKVVTLQLAGPIQVGGTYQIRLLNGIDGNPLVDECGQTTPAGSVISFIAGDTVNADFNAQVLWGCKADTINFTHNGQHNITQWNWNFNNEGTSTQQNPSYIFKKFGSKEIKLVVSNGICKDSATTTIVLDNELKAAFGWPAVLCPQDFATFTDSSIGKITSWHWNFGFGGTSTDQNPVPQKYPQVTTGRSELYTVQLIIENNLNCFDTATHQLKVVNTCIIGVPNAFTPNNDGNNDYLYPLNAYKAKNLEFNIYNRYGQLVFHTTDWTKKWDGTISGHPQATGVYVWMLKYTDGDTGEKVFKKGTTVLIR